MIAEPRSSQGGQPLTCPICSRLFLASDSTTMPFCSARCQKIDLGRWLNEDYGLPVEGQEDADSLPGVDDDFEEDELP